MSEARIVHGLLQKALIDANRICAEIRIGSDGSIWRMTPSGWKASPDRLTNPRDREDFLVGKLTQEER